MSAAFSCRLGTIGLVNTTHGCTGSRVSSSKSISNANLNFFLVPYSVSYSRNGVTSTHTALPVYSGHGAYSFLPPLALIIMCRLTCCCCCLLGGLSFDLRKLFRHPAVLRPVVGPCLLDLR